MSEIGDYNPEAFYGISFPVETAEAIDEGMAEQGIYLPVGVNLFYVETWHPGNAVDDNYEDVVKRCKGFLGIFVEGLKPSKERTNLLAFLRKQKRFLSGFSIDDITPKVMAGQFWDLDELVPDYFDTYPY